jgi:hypothetical protein
MTRKLIAVVFLLVSIFTQAQQFPTETTAAQTAVNNLASAAEAKVAALNTTNATLTSANEALAQQIASLKLVKVYSSLEWHRWGMNCAAQVGGSGNGQGSQQPAPGASFSIAPTAPAAGASNWFDCYFPDDVQPDDTKKTFSLTMPWQFPSLADSNASQALEMEIRQSLAGGLQGVCALQMNFSGNQLRIFGHVKKWFATGQAQPKLTPGVVYVVTLDCHRDSANNMVTDAITINGARLTLGYSEPYWQDNWRSMMRYAGQLDGKGTGTPYTVKRGPSTFTAY